MSEHPFDKHGANTGDPKLDVLIHGLIHQAGQGENADLVEEMVSTALKIYEDKLNRGDLKIINTAVRELRYSLKVFEPYRQIRKVALFGSARTPKNAPDYQIASKFSKAIVQKGWMVITGAASGIGSIHALMSARPDFSSTISCSPRIRRRTSFCPEDEGDAQPSPQHWQAISV